MRPSKLQHVIKKRNEAPSVDSLTDAFAAFNKASQSLERYYEGLEFQIRNLRMELEAKDMALLQNAREKEALKEIAERRNRFTAMGEMVARIVHDVRNPLGSIELFSSLLRKDLSPDDEKRRMTEQITAGVQTINHVLSNVLLFTQIPKPTRREHLLRKMVEESLGVVAHALKRRRIVVQTDIDPELRVSCDDALMKQVFLNLFLNASQAMPQGGHLSISASRSGMETGWKWEMIVRDTGCGIEEENLQRIFDPFFTTWDAGTGLGLTIVHNILHAHGGSIVVDSRVRQGCSFILRLPGIGDANCGLRS